MLSQSPPKCHCRKLDVGLCFLPRSTETALTSPRQGRRVQPSADWMTATISPTNKKRVPTHVPGGVPGGAFITLPNRNRGRESVQYVSQPCREVAGVYGPQYLCQNRFHQRTLPEDQEKSARRQQQSDGPAVGASWSKVLYSARQGGG